MIYDLEDYYEEMAYQYSHTLSVAVNMIVNCLKEQGVDASDSKSASNLIMLVEAANMAAKIVDDGYYDLQPILIEGAVLAGAEHGWLNGIFYMTMQDVGVASFHDTYGSIPDTCGGVWRHQCTGVERQFQSWVVIANSNVRRIYAEATYPGGKLYGLRDETVIRLVNRYFRRKHSRTKLQKVTGK